MKTIGLFLALMVFAIAVEAKTIRILVYGDSNTYGWAPEPNPPSVRFPIDQSWPGVMQKVLGDQYEVIIEALPGRTTDIADPEAPISGAGFDGTAYLPAAMASHAPLDLVVIMLGTNDTKPAYKRTPYGIALGAASLVEIASTEGVVTGLG
jgi:lysophospholipase L1-like esterase